MPIHDAADVDPRAEVHPAATVCARAVVEAGVKIGAGCMIAPYAVLLRFTELGECCQVHSHAVVGGVPQDRAFAHEQSACRIGAGTIIREGATVHRGTGVGTTTVVGERCFLMSNSHVGHNCTVGNDVMLVSGALLGGHVEIGDRAVISGNSAVHQFVRIGRLAMVAGVTAVVKDIPPFALTDHRGRVAGINFIGLRRAGYTTNERADIKQAFRLLYRGAVRHRELVELLRREARTAALLPLIDFLERGEGRGLCRASKRLSAAL